MDSRTDLTATPSLLDRSVSDALRSYALSFGCPVAYLEQPRVKRHLRRASTDESIHTFTRGDVEIVSLPGGLDAVTSMPWEDLDDLIALTRADVDPAARVCVNQTTVEIEPEPATLAMADEQTLLKLRAAPAAFVHNPSPMVLDMLRGAVTPSEWSDGGGDSALYKHRIGALAGGVLVALATAEEPVGRLSRLRVIVAPSHRRRGLGTTVLHMLAHRLIVEGLLPFCRLGAKNVGARALANGVGFVSFARSLTLRVVPEESAQRGS